MAGGGIKRIGSTGARALSLNSRVAHQPSRQGLLKISNLSFPVVTAWETYTPTLTNFTTSSLSAVWRRVGDSMQVKMQATLNGVATGTLAVGIPVEYSIDTTKIFNNDEVDFFGTAILRDTGTENEAAFVVFRDAKSVQMRPSEGEINLVGTAVPFTWVSGDRLGMNFEIPIQGWDANGTGSIEEIIESSFFNVNTKSVQVVESVTGLSVADNTTTDITGLTLYLEPGVYFAEIEASAFVPWSVVPTYGMFDVFVRRPDNTNLFVSEGAAISRREAASSGTRESAGQFFTLTTATTIKGSGRIAMTGGTITSRNVTKTFLKATKIG